MEFSGSIVLSDIEPLPATLRVDGDFLAIDSEVGHLGRWPLSTFRVAKEGDAFQMWIGEDMAGFEPLDPDPLADWIDKRWPLPHEDPIPPAAVVLSPAEKAEVVSEVVAQKPRFSLASVAAIGVALVLVAIVASAQLARNQPSPNLLSSVPTVTTVPPTPTLFLAGVDQVTFAWNEASDRLGIDLFLLEAPGPNRLQMNLADGLTLYATEDPATGSVRSLMIAAGPTLTEAAGEAVLAAWGTLIAAVNPELDGQGRRDLLRALDVEPNRPVPNGVNSQTVVGSASYSLRTGVLGGRALLTVTLSQ